ncbi:MAG TPA: hypothetical protein VMU94_15980 [Streptosporangiaceae bacterium]|nr:hypothetical protein [Streptosporangiaceae bacterium]
MELAADLAMAAAELGVRITSVVRRTDKSLLVTEWLDGDRLDDDRYPQRALDVGDLSAVLRAVAALNRWHPPAGVFGTTLDYPARFRRYHELAPSSVRDLRLPLIEDAWQLARERLHHAARSA